MNEHNTSDGSFKCLAFSSFRFHMNKVSIRLTEPYSVSIGMSSTSAREMLSFSSIAWTSTEGKIFAFQISVLQKWLYFNVNKTVVIHKTKKNKENSDKRKQVAELS